MSEITQDLIDALFEIKDDEEFVANVIDLASNEEDQEEILDYIKAQKKEGNEINPNFIEYAAFRYCINRDECEHG